MSTQITTALVEAHSLCPTKSFLMLGGDVEGIPHDYGQILRRRADTNRKRFIESHPESRQDISDVGLSDGVLTIAHEGLVATCDGLLKSVRGATRGHSHYEPYIVTGTRAVSRPQRLRLAFTGYVLGKVKRCRPKHGVIVTGNGTKKRVELNRFNRTIRGILIELKEMNEPDVPKEPLLVLNEHCDVCQYRQHCRQRAEDEDNLSLLVRMNRRLMRTYQEKGVSTVNQLSYLFKTRRRRKRTHAPKPVFNIELQALAIRTGKIYLHETPSIPSHAVEIFLDIEGIPDEGFHYLIGLLVKDRDRLLKHSFWADSYKDESRIFKKCLEIVNEYPEAPIFHYGNYELKAFQQVRKKHGLDVSSAERRLVNVNAFVFAKVYFPSRSNRLKELGSMLGARWPHEQSSGLQSLVWRYGWEESRDDCLKSLLTAYNDSDIEALRLLTEELRQIANEATNRADVDFAIMPKQNTTDSGREIHSQLERIVRSAHHRYEHRRIRVKRNRITAEQQNNSTKAAKRSSAIKKRNISPRANRVVRVPRKRKCPRHPTRPLRSSGETAEHSLIDLTFTRSGCRKTIVKYVGKRGYCPLCDHGYLPPKIKQLQARIFGRHFQSWTVYQRIVLRLSYRQISTAIGDLFNEKVSISTIMGFVRQLSEDYSTTERAILLQMLKSRVIHSDETKINILGSNQYVWLLTDGKHVILRLSPTRETDMIKKMLNTFSGVLVSDFYGGYDSVCDMQQKCLVHLIRDLNDDLWKHPFNAEYEAFVNAVSQLLVQIIGDIERYGLKKRHLRKNLRSVDPFYDNVINGTDPRCEMTIRYHKRFTKYRDALFLFLTEDGIPWHNNLAERVLRHFAIQRKISGSFTSKGATEYFRLLSIGQTCRLQEKSFLRFLLSGQTDVDAFKDRKVAAVH